jgi:hypothetical protein
MTCCMHNEALLTHSAKPSAARGKVPAPKGGRERGTRASIDS